MLYQTFVMYELLRKKISETIPLSDDEFEFCKTLFIPKKLRKRQYLLQEGDVDRYTGFVEKGLLRTYAVDSKGTEHILQFAFEGWWVADLASFLRAEPSMLNIEAMEECELLLITKQSWELLLQKIPAFEKFFRILTQNNLIVTQKRLIGNMSETAEEKYLNFMKDHPGCMQRVPQRMIASYLGITKETLSRIRSQIAEKSKK
ncbi:MAG TPA: Crp/Fnr family transcriptional regulator [Chitinophagaceae bacterium]|nr:Crp/Fnr family transcriptional regulator [Chitinophagaceae bacterium]